MLGRFDTIAHLCHRHRVVWSTRSFSASKKSLISPCRHLFHDGIRRIVSHDNLPLPTVVYSDNHVLVVNKPAGWHAVPNHPSRNDRSRGGGGGGFAVEGTSKKCLVTQLKSMGLGGGRQNNFLLPLHRIDQPCTGIMILGKTSKAASRITTLWKQKHVEKEYVCVVPTSRLGMLLAASTPIGNTGLSMSTTNTWSNPNDTNQLQQQAIQSNVENYEWHELQGHMLRNHNQSRNRSVIVLDHLPSMSLLSSSSSPSSEEEDETCERTRKLNLHWRILNLKKTTASSTSTIHPAYALIMVRTFEGARHMVRALLAQVGQCPIVGDVRYYQPSSMDSVTTMIPTPLKDRSVALHAFRIRFDSQRLKLGSLEQFEFEAPIPPTWKSYFGIRKDAL
jgi:23S rRNA-/tRNA-specific pseudouridylate synthase